MADDRFPSRFAANASLLPHIADLANDRVLIALLGEADYRAASFLDQRLLTDRVGREWRAWNALPDLGAAAPRPDFRSEEHTSELQSLMRISYAVFCLQKTNIQPIHYIIH